MDEAKERISGQFIRSTSPRAQRVQCVCAVCGYPVFHAGGPLTQQIDHFRHRKNTKARETCPLYHAGPHVRVRQFLGERVARLQELRLGIVLRPGKGRINWELALLVPRFEHAVSVTVGTYSPNPGDYPIEEIPVGGRAFSVFPQSTDYEVELVEEGGIDTTATIEGLMEPTTFAMGSAVSRRLESGEELAWGRTYAFLQRTWIDTKNKPIELQTRLLAENDGWHGCLLGLPAVANERVAKWIKATVRRTIANQPVSLSVLSPVSARLGNDDIWRVAPGHGPVTVALRFAEAPEGPTVLRLLTDSTSLEYVLESKSLTALVDLGNLPPGLSELRVASLYDSAITLDVSDRRPEDVELPRPRIAFMFEKSGMISTTSLWAESLPRMFDRVRKKDLILDRVLLPEEGKLSIVEFRGKKRIEELHEFSPEAATKIAERINELLSIPVAIFEIRTEGFGRVHFPKPENTANGESLVAALVPQTRHQIARSAWLRFAVGEDPVLHRRQFYPRTDVRHRFNAHLNQRSR